MTLPRQLPVGLTARRNSRFDTGQLLRPSRGIEFARNACICLRRPHRGTGGRTRRRGGDRHRRHCCGLGGTGWGLVGECGFGGRPRVGQRCGRGPGEGSGQGRKPAFCGASSSGCDSIQDRRPGPRCGRSATATTGQGSQTRVAGAVRAESGDGGRGAPTPPTPGASGGGAGRVDGSGVGPFVRRPPGRRRKRCGTQPDRGVAEQPDPDNEPDPDRTEPDWCGQR